MAEEKYAEEVARKELFRWLEAVGGEIPPEETRAPAYDEEGALLEQEPTKWEELIDKSAKAVKAIQSGALVVSDDGCKLSFTPQRGGKWAGKPIEFDEPNGTVFLAMDKGKGNIAKMAASICCRASLPRVGTRPAEQGVPLKGKLAKLTGSPGHVLPVVYAEMFFQCCMDYRSLPDPRTMTASEISSYYRRLLPSLVKGQEKQEELRKAESERKKKG